MDVLHPQILGAIKAAIDKSYRSGFNDGIQFVVDSLRDAADASQVDVYAAIQRELANMFESAKLKLPEEDVQEALYHQIKEGDVPNEQQSDGEESNS